MSVRKRTSAVWLAVIAAGCSSGAVSGSGGKGGGTGGIISTGGGAGAIRAAAGAAGMAGVAGGAAGAAGGPQDAGANDGSRDAAADAWPGVLLTPSSTGFVQDPVSGVVGSWFPFGDGIGPNPTPTSIDNGDSDCVRWGMFPPGRCSMIYSPIAGQPFTRDPSTGGMCTSGVVAQVLPGTSGAPDYADLWGAGIGLDLNYPGGEAGVKAPWDGSAFTGIAFDFIAVTKEPAPLRVLFPFIGEHGTDAPYYLGTLKAYSFLTGNSAHMAIHWSDVGGPYYLAGQSPPVTPPAFDPSKLLAIWFQIISNTSSTEPYNFCIANLTLLRD